MKTKASDRTKRTDVRPDTSLRRFCCIFDNWNTVVAEIEMISVISAGHRSGELA